MKITMTAIIKRQRARLYTQKAKKIAQRFIYKKTDTFQKARQFPLRFYIKKPYINVWQKNCCLNMNENYNDFHQRKTTHTFLYT